MLSGIPPETGRVLDFIVFVSGVVDWDANGAGMISFSDLSTDTGVSTREALCPALPLDSRPELVGSSCATTPNALGISKSWSALELSGCLTLSSVVVEASGEATLPSRVVLLTLNGYATTPLCGRELPALRYVLSDPGTLNVPLALPASDIEEGRSRA